MIPPSRLSYKACSSKTAPLVVLIKIAFDFICSNCSFPINCRVSGVKATPMTTTSAFLSTSAMECAYAIVIALAFSSVKCLDQPITCIPKPFRQISAVCRLISPTPIRPNTLPHISIPRSSAMRTGAPSVNLLSACTIFRPRASIRATFISATDRLFR